MKLNADIVFDNLSQTVLLESHGKMKKELVLKRPQFYRGGNREFKLNQIYVVLADRLPNDPIFGGGTVIIVVGGYPPVTYYVENCVCFIIKDDTDLFSVFNSVQQIFDKYDEWNDGLQKILNTTASIKDLVEFSSPIFENPILVLDANYHYLGYSNIINIRDDLALYRPDKDGNLALETFNVYLDDLTTNMSETRPFLLTLKDTVYFVKNLFENNVYAGSLTVPFVLRQQRQGDIALALFLSKIIENSFKKYSMLISGQFDILRGILQDLLNGYPIDSARLQFIKEENQTIVGQYVCIKMIPGLRSHKVPVEYICNLLESSFPGCISFEFESAIVSYMNIKKVPGGYEPLTEMILEILKEMGWKAGASYLFANVAQARLYYRQASVALDIGSSANPKFNYYPFHNYVLTYMMSHCLGEFPLEYLLPEGLSQLVEHDLHSETNYIHTLRTYLNNNMNTAKTAKDLFIHRSTFLERFERLEKMLNTDLEDPNQRLRILISLKVIENNENLAAKQVERNSGITDNSLDYQKKFLDLGSIYSEN